MALQYAYANISHVRASLGELEARYKKVGEAAFAPPLHRNYTNRKGLPPEGRASL